MNTRNSVKQRQEELVREALEIIRDATAKEYDGRYIRWSHDIGVQVYKDGNVFLSIGYAPLTWAQRRTISRAFARKGRELEQIIFEAGRKALTSGSQR